MIQSMQTGSVRYTDAGAGGEMKELYESMEEVNRKLNLTFYRMNLLKHFGKKNKRKPPRSYLENVKRTGEIVNKYTTLL